MSTIDSNFISGSRKRGYYIFPYISYNMRVWEGATVMVNDILPAKGGKQTISENTAHYSGEGLIKNGGVESIISTQQEVLKKWFPSRYELLEHQQVIYFLCELLEDAPVQPQVLIEYVWEKTQSGDILPASAHHTESGHYYSKTNPVPIDTLSRRYVFYDREEAVEWKVPPGSTVPEQLKECEVSIDFEDMYAPPEESRTCTNLMSVCGRISEHQLIRRLEIEELIHSGTTPHPVILSPNIEAVVIRNSKIPDDTLNYLMSQLHRLQGLKELDLSYTRLPGPLPALPPSLQVLHLQRYASLRIVYQITLEDVSEVVRAVQRPTLREVNLRENDLGEEAVGWVLEAALTHRPHQELELGLRDNDLSREFEDRWDERCAGTQIHPD